MRQHAVDAFAVKEGDYRALAQTRAFPVHGSTHDRGTLCIALLVQVIGRVVFAHVGELVDKAAVLARLGARPVGNR